MKTYAARFLASAPGPQAYPASELPQVAFVGRSNSGKSTMINTLVGMRGLARVSQKPGRTREIHFYEVEQRFMLVDLPGYGFASVSKVQKATWENMVGGYIQKSQKLRAIVALFDIRRNPDMLDRSLVELIRTNPQATWQAVWTKADKIKSRQRVERASDLDDAFMTPSPGIVFSSRTRQGRDDLLDWIEKQIASGSPC